MTNSARKVVELTTRVGPQRFSTESNIESLSTRVFQLLFQNVRFSNCLQLFAGYSDVAPEISIVNANNSVETLLCGLVHHSEPSGSGIFPVKTCNHAEKSFVS